MSYTLSSLPRKLAVQITEAHIAAGKRNKAHCCPIALALTEQFFVPGYLWRVDETNCALTRGYRNKHAAEFELCSDTVKFVRHFDDLGTGEPFLASVLNLEPVAQKGEAA